jgi:hypothetical protein
MSYLTDEAMSEGDEQYRKFTETLKNVRMLTFRR